MAQKTGKEDAEFKVPETLTLCINKCGVIGNPATNNMCQNCFKTTTTATVTTISSSSSTVSGIMKFSAEKITRSRSSTVPEKSNLTPDRSRNSLHDRSDSHGASAKRTVNRCSGCKRKVGLTGFRCRCGDLFCSEHRYSDRHVCSYDYKTAGRETIARENPVVKAAKIVRV